ncbi:MAG: hypothetical protein JW950_03500 [Deltaproteobacteria bacterium]|nr:hypothetical protein [Deltaproteobacteria bacterium]
MKRWHILSGAALLLLMITACGGLRYSQVAPEAKDFHPKAVGVLPVDVGTYEEARGTIDQIIAGVLIDKKWFSDVVASDTITGQLMSSEEYRKVLLDYLAKFKTVNYSDPELSQKIGDVSKIDAFLVFQVDYWNYTIEDGDKVAKVGLAVKMVDAGTGKILWKAGHHITEKYILIKPNLNDVAKKLVKKMLDEMPH